MTLLEKEWFIQVPWGRLCIVAWGDCRDPPVLLCHGNIDSAATFRPLVALLPKKFYYIGMELPGNGKSDHYPSGMVITSYDMLYSVVAVVKHFRWEHFVYIGHSYGSSLGKMYALAFPGKQSKIIVLDPVTNHLTTPIEDFSKWYQRSLHEYFKNFDKYNLPKEDGPKFRKQEVIAKFMKNRQLTEEAAEAVLARLTEPAGDGDIRYTFDQRLKISIHYPISSSFLKELYTSIKTPILTIVSDESVKKGQYDMTKFLLDEKAFPAGNYRVREVAGHHDIHVVHPERIAPYIENFLLFGLEGLDGKSKL